MRKEAQIAMLALSALTLPIHSESINGGIFIKPNDPSIAFEGRFRSLESGEKDFDLPGSKITLQVEGTTSVDVVLTSKGTDQPHRFWIYIDGALTENIVDTKGMSLDEVKTFNIASGLSTSPHTISLFKVTEADYNNPNPHLNYLTLNGFQIDQGTLKESSPLAERRIEFIGDSITAGYCNMCHEIDSSNGAYAQESFASSWANKVCVSLNSSCNAVGKIVFIVIYFINLFL